MSDNIDLAANNAERRKAMLPRQGDSTEVAEQLTNNLRADYLSGIDWFGLKEKSAISSEFEKTTTAAASLPYEVLKAEDEGYTPGLDDVELTTEQEKALSVWSNSGTAFRRSYVETLINTALAAGTLGGAFGLSTAWTVPVWQGKMAIDFGAKGIEILKKDDLGAGQFIDNPKQSIVGIAEMSLPLLAHKSVFFPLASSVIRYTVDDDYVKYRENEPVASLVDNFWMDILLFGPKGVGSISKRIPNKITSPFNKTTTTSAPIETDTSNITRSKAEVSFYRGNSKWRENIRKPEGHRDALGKTVESVITAENYEARTLKILQKKEEGRKRDVEPLGKYGNTLGVKELDVNSVYKNNPVNVITLRKIASKIVPNKFGKLKYGDDTRGYYDDVTQGIGTRYLSDIGVLDHELAHHFDSVLTKSIRGTDVNSQANKELIESIKGHPDIEQKLSPEKAMEEGATLFFEEYLLQSERAHVVKDELGNQVKQVSSKAKEDFPEYYKIFEEQLASKPELKKVLEEYSEARRRYILEDPTQRDGTEYYDPDTNKLENINTNELPLNKKGELGFIDDLSPIKDMVKEYEKTTGVKLKKFEDNPYNIAMNARGSAASQANILLGLSISDSTLALDALGDYYGCTLNHVTFKDVFINEGTSLILKNKKVHYRPKRNENIFDELNTDTDSLIGKEEPTNGIREESLGEFIKKVIGTKNTNEKNLYKVESLFLSKFSELEAAVSKSDIDVIVKGNGLDSYYKERMAIALELINKDLTPQRKAELKEKEFLLEAEYNFNSYLSKILTKINIMNSIKNEALGLQKQIADAVSDFYENLKKFKEVCTIIKKTPKDKRTKVKKELKYKKVKDDAKNSLNALRKIEETKVKDFLSKYDEIDKSSIEKFSKEEQDNKRFDAVDKLLKNSLIRETSLSKNDIINILTESFPLEFQPAIENLRLYNENLLRIREASGLQSKEVIDSWRKKRPHYLPLKRDMTSEYIAGEGEPVRNPQEILMSQAGLKNGQGKKLTAEGSDRVIIDPLLQVEKQTILLMHAVQHNEVAKSFAKLADMPYRDPNNFKAGALRFVERVPDTDNGPLTFKVFRNGTQQTYKLKNAVVYNAFMNNASNIIDRLTNHPWLKKPASEFRDWTTGKNLYFAVQNIIMDSLFGQTLSLDKSWTKYIPAYGLYEMVTKYPSLANKNSSLLAKSEVYGVPMSNFVQTTRNLAKQSREWANISEKTTLGKIASNWNKLIKVSEDANTSFELGPRLKAMDEALKSGKSDLEAAAIAKDATVNFGRHGTYGQAVNRVIPFTNAAIQGTNRFIRAFKEVGPGVIASRIIMNFGIPYLGYYNMVKDENWYKELSVEEKLTYFHIPTPFKDSYGKRILIRFKMPEFVYRIPVSLILGYDAYTRDNPVSGHIVKEIIKSNAKSVLPSSITPTVTHPFTALYGTYFGNGKWANTPPENQADVNTPAIIRGAVNSINFIKDNTSDKLPIINEVPDLSPEYVNRALKGTVGSMLYQTLCVLDGAADWIINGAAETIGGKPLYETGYSNTAGDLTQKHFSRWVRSEGHGTVRTEYENVFYDLSAKAEKAYKTENIDSPYYDYYRPLQRANRQISRINKELKEINKPSKNYKKKYKQKKRNSLLEEKRLIVKETLQDIGYNFNKRNGGKKNK